MIASIAQERRSLILPCVGSISSPSFVTFGGHIPALDDQSLDLDQHSDLMFANLAVALLDKLVMYTKDHKLRKRLPSI